MFVTAQFISQFIASQQKRFFPALKVTPLLLAFYASGGYAGVPCGSGKIIDIKEGGWNRNGLALQLSGPDSTVGDNTKRSGTGTRLYVYYNANLGNNRLDALRRLAAMAFALDATVWTYSHTNNCSAATELSVLK